MIVIAQSGRWFVSFFGDWSNRTNWTELP